jgi:hypothetical protein
MPDQANRPNTPLHESLLAGPAVAVERRRTSRWAYSVFGMLLASVFVLYHGSTLLVWNTPSKGLLKSFHASFLDKTKANLYFKGTRLTQSWGMFAPNPNRTNVFVQVFVTDQDGVLWNFEQDIWEKNRYPYVWYDRGGKVNRNLDGKKHYQRIYGAWVCREWERQNAGVAPKSVTFIKRWTSVPDARVIIKQGGWDQWKAPNKQKEQETITCKTVVHGTLPNELRGRFGLPEIDEDKEFRPVADRTWWDKQERERKLAEQAAARSEVKRAPATPVEPAEPGDDDSVDQ